MAGWLAFWPGPGPAPGPAPVRPGSGPGQPARQASQPGQPAKAARTNKKIIRQKSNITKQPKILALCQPAGHSARIFVFVCCWCYCFGGFYYTFFVFWFRQPWLAGLAGWPVLGPGPALAQLGPGPGLAWLAGWPDCLAALACDKWRRTARTRHVVGRYDKLWSLVEAGNQNKKKRALSATIPGLICGTPALLWVWHDLSSNFCFLYGHGWAQCTRMTIWILFQAIATLPLCLIFSATSPPPATLTMFDDLLGLCRAQHI